MQEQVLRIHCIEHQQHIHCIHQQCKLQFGYGRQGGERDIFHWLQRHLCNCKEKIRMKLFEVGNVETNGRFFFQVFVAFAEKLNFNIQILGAKFFTWIHFDQS